ncbi:DUF1311 domain-containing protein [Acinetobacter shaoyimingii]|uniref:DUF1311 domain-containing protein n=2 Tax=Acinetobacter shaoyimingii TaxID=2715164 RepID=A0A6G8S077_9GAMM|nr:DUF1311 domain-containing protein [Acinetobacter shaoyimingii]QIO07500.1 DUF1311 domain-containing protein [Acinetobacter shaoyimingii]
MALAGCDKVSTFTGSSIKCDNETAKQLVVESFSKVLSDASAERVKNLIASENITIDMGKLRAALAKVTFNVTDIRTNNSDPNSKKEYCVTNFVVNIPGEIITDADAARAVYDDTKVAQAAVLADLSLESNQLKTSIDYMVQPTDDAKKVYVQLENGESVAYFVRDVVIDSLLKSARLNAAEIAKQEELQRQAEEAAAEKEYNSLLISEAQTRLDNANKNLNLVWNATTKEVRDQLLDEQKIWLKKRDLECKLDSTDAVNPEIHRLNCEASMTEQRTSVLRQKIFYLE